MSSDRRLLQEGLADLGFTRRRFAELQYPRFYIGFKLRVELAREAREVTQSIIETKTDIAAAVRSRDLDPEHIAARAAKRWAETYGRKHRLSPEEVAKEAAQKWAHMRAAELEEKTLEQDRGKAREKEHEREQQRRHSLDDAMMTTASDLGW